MNLEIRDLRLIEAIARQGTMTRASVGLHVSQSALSHQLTDLERTVGVALFERTPRRMLLTPEGERLLTTAQAVLQELRDAEQALREGTLDDSGVLRISTECYTCYHWLPRCVAAFERQFPRLEVQVVVEATRAPVEALLDGRIDVAIVTSGARRPGLNTRTLFRDELVVIMSPKNNLASRGYVRAEDFAGQHLLTYSVPEEHLTIFAEILTPAGVRPAKVSRMELTEAVVEMVKANRGIAVLARWAAAPYLDPGLLKAVRLTRRGVFRDWVGVVRASRKQPKYVGAFLETLAQEGAPVF